MDVAKRIALMPKRGVNRYLAIILAVLSTVMAATGGDGVT
jgi:hypothetical protein